MATEDVPMDMPEGRTVENTAGEDVPKLINAADDARAGLEVTSLRLTDKDPGTPEVVRCEDAAVGAMVEDITRILVETVSVGSNEVDLMDEAGVGVVDVSEDRSGPRPSDRVTTEATVSAPLDGLTRGLEVRLDRIPVVVPVDEKPKVGKVPVKVAVGPVRRDVVVD